MVPCDGHLRPLADDIAPEADPGPPDELEAETGPGTERIGPPAGRLEHDEHRTGPSGERREPAESVEDPARPLESGWQVDEQQVHRPGLEKRTGQGQALVEGRRDEHGEPFEADPAGHGLDRVEAAVEVQPGDERTGRLGLGEELECECGSPARGLAPEGDRTGPGDPTRAEERIELGEPRRDDRDGGAGRRTPPRDPGRPRDGQGGGRRGDIRCIVHPLVRQRDRRERADDGAEGILAATRRGGAPAIPEGREGGVDVTQRTGHRTANIERMFYRVKVRTAWCGLLRRAAVRPSSCYTLAPVEAPRAPAAVLVGM